MAGGCLRFLPSTVLHAAAQRPAQFLMHKPLSGAPVPKLKCFGKNISNPTSHYMAQKNAYITSKKSSIGINSTLPIHFAWPLFPTDLRLFYVLALYFALLNCSLALVPGCSGATTHPQKVTSLARFALPFPFAFGLRIPSHWQVDRFSVGKSFKVVLCLNNIPHALHVWITDPQWPTCTKSFFTTCKRHSVHTSETSQTTYSQVSLGGIKWQDFSHMYPRPWRWRPSLKMLKRPVLHLPGGMPWGYAMRWLVKHEKV